jgi:hypothetical protein
MNGRSRRAVSTARRLVSPSRPKLDPLDAQGARLVGLVPIPRLDDRLGLFAASEELDGFLG